MDTVDIAETAKVGYGLLKKKIAAVMEILNSKVNNEQLNSAIANGSVATAAKLATARTIALTGAVTGSGSFDGSGNLSIATAWSLNPMQYYHNSFSGWTGSSGSPTTTTVTYATLMTAFGGWRLGRVYVYDPNGNSIMTCHGNMAYVDVVINLDNTIREATFVNIYKDGYRGVTSVNVSGSNIIFNFTGNSISNERLRVTAFPGMHR